MGKLMMALVLTLSLLVGLSVDTVAFCQSKGETNIERTFGGIELGGTLGGYEIVNVPATKLPQDVASAVSNLNTNLLGATFNPLWYVGKQTVNGVNHLFIAEEIRITKTTDKYIVGLVVNVPPGANADKGEGAKVVRIIESEALPEDVEEAFLTVSKPIVGVSYRPIMLLGKQVVKGENYYILCEAKTIYPGTEPKAVVFVVNVFDGKPSLVGIAPIGKDTQETICGYAFTW